jgi:hypothetical protein
MAMGLPTVDDGRTLKHNTSSYVVVTLLDLLWLFPFYQNRTAKTLSSAPSSGSAFSIYLNPGRQEISVLTFFFPSLKRPRFTHIIFQLHSIHLKTTRYKHHPLQSTPSNLEVQFIPVTMKIIIALLFALVGFLGTAIGNPVAAVAAIDNALVENLAPRKVSSP